MRQGAVEQEIAAPERVRGEYIVTAPGIDAARLRRLFSVYEVRDVADLGAGRFLIRLNRDPGPAEIERTALGSGDIKAIQPNFIYRAQ